jgi:transposase
VASRFYRWRQAGIWDRLFAAVQQQADAVGQRDWELHFVDGTTIRAHQHAAGAKKGARLPKRSAGVKGASAPKSTSAPKAGGNS